MGTVRRMHILLAILAACLVEKSDQWGPDGKVAVKVETVASGLETPWSFAFLDGGDVLVSERPGRVRLLQNGKLNAQPVLTLKTGESSEGGLLGIAVNPKNPAQLFLFATVAGPVNELQRWRLSADHRSATFEKVLLGGIPAGTYHDGGRIRFGPDGMLYVGTGDGTRPDRAQDRESRNGKILRLTPDGAVPADNPIPGNPLWIYGVRNPEAFDWFDDGTLVLADHGPSGELGRSTHDRVVLGRKGENLGWPTIFGCQEKAGMVTPLITWEGHALPPGGAAVYRGSAIPAWKGSFLVASLGAEQLQRLVIENGVLKLHEVYFRQKLGRLRELEMTPTGELWMTTSNCDGRGECGSTKDKILRVVPQ
jgi:glucose/arabinose dehydrogenase